MDLVASSKQELGSMLQNKLIYALFVAFGVLIVHQIYEAISQYLTKYKKLVNIPTINLYNNDYAAAEADYVANAPQLLAEGRAKFPNQAFQLWGLEGYMIIIPEAWVDEIKNADADKLDNEALIKGVIGNYEWIKLGQPVLPHTIAKDLTPKLGLLLPDMQDELRYVLDTELPPCNDWEPVQIMPFLMRAVALISGRIFVGAPLNRDPVWIQVCTEFVLDLFKAGEQVRRLPQFLTALCIKLGLIPTVERVRKEQRQAREMLLPLLQARKKAKESDSNWVPPKDMLQFIMDAPHSRSASFSDQSLTQLVLAMSSIQATSFVATNVIFDLAAHPEYIEPIRAEVEEAFATGGPSLDKRSITNMTKLDSFLKESQRLNPSQHLTFDRGTTAPNGITFKNGFHLPKGTRFAVASTQVNRNYDNPDEFDGSRFERLRQSSTENSLRHQFVATNTANSMSFGVGKHACPGRFFAANQIKLIVAMLLLEYDIKFPVNVTTRPKSIVFGHNQKPDSDVQILFKKRTAGSS